MASVVINTGDSILMGVREACNVSPEDDGFDRQLIPLINSQLMMAHHQLGIGFNGFKIKDATAVWSDWLGSAEGKLEAAKSWLGLSVLKTFDPPENSSALQSLERTIDRMEWVLCSKSAAEGHARNLYLVEFDDD